MNFLLLSLLRALTRPSYAELLPTPRKSDLIEAEWYVRLAAEGERERRGANRPPPPAAAANSPV